jgi:hypothetical protein
MRILTVIVFQFFNHLLFSHIIHASKLMRKAYVISIALKNMSINREENYLSEGHLK